MLAGFLAKTPSIPPPQEHLNPTSWGKRSVLYRQGLEAAFFEFCYLLGRTWVLGVNLRVYIVFLKGFGGFGVSGFYRVYIGFRKGFRIPRVWGLGCL